MSYKKKIELINEAHGKKPRPHTLKEACLFSIEKWESLINIALTYGTDYTQFVSFSGHESCSLCRFYIVDNTESEICSNCPLKNCKKSSSIYHLIRNAETPELFVERAFKLIKKIRKGYKKKTGEVLLSHNN